MTPIHLVEVATKLAFLEHTDETCFLSSTKHHAYTIIVVVVLNDEQLERQIIEIKINSIDRIKYFLIMFLFLNVCMLFFS